jgi:hypothetical protein
MTQATRYAPTPWQALDDVIYPDPMAEGEQAGIDWIADCRTGNGSANAEHIVRCVNAHDELVAALRKADEVITALFPGVRNLAVDVGMLNDNCLAIRAALNATAPAAKPEQRIYTFAVESPSEGPYTMEWQEENEAAARRQVEQRARVLAPAGTKVGRLLGTRPA